MQIGFAYFLYSNLNKYLFNWYWFRPFFLFYLIFATQRREDTAESNQLINADLVQVGESFQLNFNWISDMYWFRGVFLDKETKRERIRGVDYTFANNMKIIPIFFSTNDKL